jgi:hypothetical protein
MSNDINGLLSTFKTNMMNNGVIVESSDRFKTLIDKIATMVEEGSGKGIQFTSGTVESTYDILYENKANYTLNKKCWYYEIPSIGFKPMFIISREMNIPLSNSRISIYFDGIYISSYGTGADTNSGSFQLMNTNDSYCALYVNENNALMPIHSLQSGRNYVFTYYAIGVGEDDTTLLDSLKSILAEEGVITTEEDDMASLITKVDNEFNDKNNEINGLNTTITNKNNEINDMKQDLTNALVNKGLNVNTGSSFDELIGSIGNINNYIAKAGSTYKIINIANHTAGRLLMDTYLELTNVLLIVPGTYTVSFELYTGSYDEIGGSTNSSPGYCRVQHVRGGTVVSTVDEYSTKYPGETFNININNVKTGDQIYIYGKTANTSRFYNVRNIIISCSL